MTDGRGSSACLVEWVGFNLRKLVFHVVGIHGSDLVSGRRAEDLDDLDELVDARLSGEQRLAQHELGHDAAGGPNV
jgi:hypothetical protein